VTAEMLQTVFFKIAAILNSRPILGDSTDVTRWVITPNQLTNKVEEVDTPVPLYRDSLTCKLRRVRHVQLIIDQFWLRWKDRVLPAMVRLPKWSKDQRNMQIGDIVMVSSDNKLKNEYRCGRLIEVKTHRDGFVRSGTVQLRSGGTQEFSIHQMSRVPVD
jgi:hypothetical protein